MSTVPVGASAPTLFWNKFFNYNEFNDNRANMGRAEPDVERDVDDQDPEPLTSGAASLLLPGVGQLLNNDFVKAIAFALIALYMWGFQLGWVIHLLAAFEASRSASVIAEKRKMLRDLQRGGSKRNQ